MTEKTGHRKAAGVDRKPDRLSLGQRLLRWLLHALGRVIFFVGFVLLAVYAPMLALVALGQLQAGLPAGTLEAVPSLPSLIVIPAIGGLMMLGGTLIRRRLANAGLDQER